MAVATLASWLAGPPAAEPSAVPAERTALRPSFRLEEGGDLEVLGIATPAYLPGFRYLIATLSREGVASVHGRTLSGARAPGAHLHRS